jgi:leader peptidase (prepilin peptidase) / N-methyltransferase
MHVAFAAVAFAPGLAIGSFLNVVASRMPLRRSVAGRSACVSCGAKIASRDNVPLLSYVLLRGRCRHCGVRIPARYPIVEATTALLAATCALRFGITGEAMLAAVFCAVLVAVAAIDLEHRIVPNRIVLPAAVAGLATRMVLDPSMEWPLAALGASGFLFAAALAYPRGMGMGDVKLALLLGAVLGTSAAVALMLGMVAALVPAAILAARAGAARARKTAIPFAPFLGFGAVVALLAGDAILDWYLGVIGG